MEIDPLEPSGLVVLAPKIFRDARGSFSETWNRSRMQEAGLHHDFVQDNHSVSVPVHTLRGMHYQAPPHGQAKLVRCIRGRIWDVAVDVRRGSPTYGAWAGVELTPENGKQLLVPIGFLHGFVTLEPDSEVLYKCSDYYAPGSDGSVLWSSCGIDWPFVGAPVLSDKDAAAPALAAFESPFEWGDGT